MSQQFHMKEILPHAEFEFSFWANMEKQQIISILSNKNSEAKQQLLLILIAPYWGISYTQIMQSLLWQLHITMQSPRSRYKTFHLSRKFSTWNYGVCALLCPLNSPRKHDFLFWGMDQYLIPIFTRVVSIIWYTTILLFTSQWTFELFTFLDYYK